MLTFGNLQLAKVLTIRKLLDWAPLIITTALGSDYLHLALILATAISAGNIVLDALFRWWKIIKVGFFSPSCQVELVNKIQACALSSSC